MAIIMTFIASLLFGLGLVVSGLASPAKVQNFLDVAGNWDPSLAFTMGGAVLITALGFWIVLKRDRPLFAEVFHLPKATDIDSKLVSGAALFGVGWGLVGYCPGPAIAALTVGGTPTLTFVGAMLVGMLLARLVSASR
jgi:uncharacterized protein